MMTGRQSTVPVEKEHEDSSHSYELKRLRSVENERKQNFGWNLEDGVQVDWFDRCMWLGNYVERTLLIR